MSQNADADGQTAQPAPEMHSSSGGLTDEQIQMINEALARIGEFGQVKLVKEKGKLRFLVCEESFDIFNYHPGNIGEHTD